LTLATAPSNAIESLIAMLVLALVHLFVKELGFDHRPAGWAIGFWVEVSPNVVALWYAFLAGVTVFTALLLILEQMPQAVV